MKLDKFSWDWFGEARKATVTKEQTTIVDGKGGIEAIEARVEELQQQIEKHKRRMKRNNFKKDWQNSSEE